MVGAGVCGGGWHSHSMTPVPACRQQRVGEVPGGRVQVLRAPLDVGAGAAHLQLVPGGAGVGAQRGRAALPGPEPEKGTRGTGTSPGADGLRCVPGLFPPRLLSSFAGGMLSGDSRALLGSRWVLCGGSRSWCPGAGLGLSKVMLFATVQAAGGLLGPCARGGHGCPQGHPVPARALMCPLRACSSPGARSSTGGSGCTPMRTTGGSSKSENEPPHPCTSPCHRPQLSEHCGSVLASRGSLLGCWDGGSSPTRGQWWGTLLVRACNWSHSPSHCSASCSHWCLSQVVRRVPPQLRFLGAGQAPAHQQGQEVRVHDSQQR